MDNLSSPTQAFKDVNGKFHDTQDQADKASAQILLDRANTGGTLSVQALAHLLATNPSMNTYLSKLIAADVEKIRQQAAEQVGETETPKNKK